MSQLRQSIVDLAGHRMQAKWLVILRITITKRMIYSAMSNLIECQPPDLLLDARTLVVSWMFVFVFMHGQLL